MDDDCFMFDVKEELFAERIQELQKKDRWRDRFVQNSEIFPFKLLFFLFSNFNIIVVAWI